MPACVQTRMRSCAHRNLRMTPLPRTVRSATADRMNFSWTSAELVDMTEEEARALLRADEGIRATGCLNHEAASTLQHARTLLSATARPVL
jgi:hypothetical protein